MPPVRRDIDWRGAAMALAWPLLAVAAARVPALEAALPALGVARGPLGWLLLLLAAAVAAGRVFDARPLAARLARASPLALFAIAALSYATIGLWYASRLRVSGDEPHYLLMAQSLWREGDLDLADNHAREDWRENTPGPVAPHYGAPRADGRPFPAHSPGLPFLLAPVYAMGGRLACVIALSVLAAGATVAARMLALQATGSREAASFAWLAALGPPLAYYAFHVYTEAPSAVAAAGALALLLGPPSPPSAIAAALLASALPWLHVKMIPAAAALGVVALVRLRGRVLAAFLAVAVAAGTAFLGYYHAIFGVASPLALYGGLPVEERGSPARAAFGLLLDRSFGLLWHAPVFLIALGAIPDAWRRRRWPHALVAAAIVLPVVGWRMWWGGQSPPARFLAPLAPFLAVMVSLRLAPAPAAGLARWRWPLAAIGIGLLLVAARAPGDLLLLNRGERPTRLWAALSAGADAGSYLPSLVAARPDDVRVAVVWTLVIGVLLALDALARRRPAIDGLFRGTALPVVLLLAAGAGIDHWARRGDGASAISSADTRRP
jgi:hypothetical protein